MKAIIPLLPDQLAGPFACADDSVFEVLAVRGKAVLIEFRSAPVEVKWFQDFELMYCQQQHDSDTVKVIRKATDEERKTFRVPLWIQGEEVPECCGRRMFFVGQIDDDKICTEPPDGAEMWWHDAASFYVFTCSRCLGVKAVGQQF